MSSKDNEDVERGPLQLEQKPEQKPEQKGVVLHEYYMERLDMLRGMDAFLWFQTLKNMNFDLLTSDQLNSILTNTFQKAGNDRFSRELEKLGACLWYVNQLQKTTGSKDDNDLLRADLQTVKSSKEKTTKKTRKRGFCDWSRLAVGLIVPALVLYCVFYQ